MSGSYFPIPPRLQATRRQPAPARGVGRRFQHRRAYLIADGRRQNHGVQGYRQEARRIWNYGKTVCRRGAGPHGWLSEPAHAFLRRYYTAGTLPDHPERPWRFRHIPRSDQRTPSTSGKIQSHGGMSRRYLIISAAALAVFAFLLSQDSLARDAW